MFLLITGASGVGKSTVRRTIESRFADVLETHELAELGGTPESSLRWRHESVERCVQRALRLQEQGKHFLLCGDPVPPGEVLAAPSADRLNGLATCLLHATPDVHRDRLGRRGEDPELVPRHTAFADWMRRHVVDCAYRPDVIVRDGWEEMRWDRWVGARRPPWSCHIIETSDLSPAEVSALAAAWVERTIQS